MKNSILAESPDAYVHALTGWRRTLVESLREFDARLKPGGEYEMATIALTDGDTVGAALAKRLVEAAVALNQQWGDPTAAAKHREG